MNDESYIDNGLDVDVLKGVVAPLTVGVLKMSFSLIRMGVHPLVALGVSTAATIGTITAIMAFGDKFELDSNYNNENREGSRIMGNIQQASITFDAGNKYGGVQHDAAAIVGVSDEAIGIGGGYKESFKRIISHLSEVSREAVDAIGGTGNSTMTAVMITPEGEMHHATLGDSPLMAVRVDANNNLVSAELVNNLDSPLAYKQNVIASVAGDIGKFESDPSRSGTLDIHSQLNSGDRMIIINGSDGLLDGIGNAPQSMSNDEGLAHILSKNRKRVMHYGDVVSKTLKDGGGLDDISQNVVNASYDFAGNHKRDNITAGVVVVDPENPIKEAVVMVTADGNGENGKDVSSKIAQSTLNDVGNDLTVGKKRRLSSEASLDNNVQHYDYGSDMRGVSSDAFARVSSAIGGFADKIFGQKAIGVRDADWQPEKVNGQNVAMVETTDMSHRGLSNFKDELGDNGISFNTASNESGTRSSIAVSDPNSLGRLQNYVQTGNPETTLAQSRSMDTNYSGLGM